MTHLQFTLNFEELKEQLMATNIDEVLKSTMVIILND